MNASMNLTRRTLLAESLVTVPAGVLVAGSSAASAADAGQHQQPERSPSKAAYSVYEIGAQKGLDSLVMAKRKVPMPGAGEVLVHVRASALNNRDIRIMSNQYAGPKPLSRIPLADGAGEVVALGAGVVDVAVGDRVTACQYPHWLAGDLAIKSRTADLGSTVDGWLAEFAIIPAAAIVKIPAIFSYEEAACLPVAAATIWNCIVAFGQIKGGETLLTLGTGGVSVMSLQLGRLFGARVAITSSSDQKLERMKAMGADIVVNYAKEADWDKALLKATDGVGVDVVTETGGPETIGKSIASCALNGRIACLSSVSAKPTSLPPDFTSVLGRNLTIRGVTSGSRKMLEQAIRALATNSVRPVIDKVFEFSQARDAYAFMATGSHIGKVVIRHG